MIKVIGGIEKVDHTTDLTSLMPVLNTKDIKASGIIIEYVSLCIGSSLLNGRCVSRCCGTLSRIGC